MAQLFGGRKFARVYVPDTRNANFPITATLDPSLPTFQHWSSHNVWDQGQTSMCTAYSATGYRAAGPIVHKIDYSIPELYHELQLNDEWDGEDYEGSSVLAAMKVFKKRGYIQEYRWATTVEQAIAHVLTVSPVIAGTTWYEGMMQPDDQGFIRLSGASVGGHAYVLLGCNTLKKCPDGTLGAFRILNSWSYKWGAQGRAWLSFSDFAKLLADDGEVAAAIETPLAA